MATPVPGVMAPPLDSRDRQRSATVFWCSQDIFNNIVGDAMIVDHVEGTQMFKQEVKYVENDNFVNIATLWKNLARQKIIDLFDEFLS